jgi:hypothetical protein
MACDIGEQCINGELGFDATGTAITFNAFNVDSRAGVIHQSLGANGVIDDTFIVTFIGTPSAASTAPQFFSSQQGIWTIRVDIKSEGGNIREKPLRPTPVIQLGDNIGSRQVTGLQIYDPIALATRDDAGNARVQRRPDHQLVFWASTDNGGTPQNIIVRATHIDSDEDGLPDHWETSGVDFNNDGTIDLPLNQAPFNANPNRKDVFVEIDYMETPTRTHRPDRRPNNMPLGTPVMQAVRNAFANAPVTNQNGTLGITLHDFVDEPLPEIDPLLFPVRGPNAADDFDDLKFGSNNPTTPGVPCGTGANDGHFGTNTDRASPNCSNILGAKRLAFRYSIFGQRYIQQIGATPRTSSGIAEAFGNDFIVTLAVSDPAYTDFEDAANSSATMWGTSFDIEFASLQAGTFMHELGHTLGLYHGGNEALNEFNCKPNYLRSCLNNQNLRRRRTEKVARRETSGIN